MDAEILEAQRGEDGFEILRQRTRAGLKTTVRDIEVIRRIRETGFTPLANFKVPVLGFFISLEYGRYKTSHCRHLHRTKKSARNCLNRAVHRYWSNQLGLQ